MTSSVLGPRRMAMPSAPLDGQRSLDSQPDSCRVSKEQRPRCRCHAARIPQCPAAVASFLLSRRWRQQDAACIIDIGHDAGILPHLYGSNSPPCTPRQRLSCYHGRATASTLPVVRRSYLAASYYVCDGSPRECTQSVDTAMSLSESAIPRWSYICEDNDVRLCPAAGHRSATPETSTEQDIRPNARKHSWSPSTHLNNTTRIVRGNGESIDEES
ncbi:hypothetical protein BV25DRAFT_1372692 [Artomyces pyxidatus]|uniref:Uncharacterized protein n=1 Tax=Artomyces pyxidatus TaxID=48021 RepID=A0ACB8SMX5_9AGAM|nr:hypothetical protein BV25DRAFT_1372692 [Artomyces pyxidatus]